MRLGLTIRDFIKTCGGELVMGNPYSPLESVSIDSRATQAGDFFFALTGERTDGHKFISDACERGAGGLVLNFIPTDLPDRSLARWPQILRVKDTLITLQTLARAHRRRFELNTVCITGTNGKTTTKNMLGAILKETGNSAFVTKGNLNSQIGLPLMVLELSGEHKWAALEIGASKAGEIARLAEIAMPQIGVIINVGPAHLETFGSLENVAKTKWELAEHLPPDGELIINRDDSLLCDLAAKAPCSVTTFGLNGHAPVGATDISTWPRPEFTLNIKGLRAKVTLNCLGKFNIYNALAAAACAWRLGVGFENIVKGLSNFHPQHMRMEEIRLPSGGILINDAYNANPASMRSSLEAFMETYPDRERIIVVGEMLELGELAESAHKSLGSLLAKSPLEAIFVLGQVGEFIRNGAKELPANTVPIFIYDTKEELTRALQKRLSPRSAILFKASRGVHLEEIVEKLQ